MSIAETSSYQIQNATTTRNSKSDQSEDTTHSTSTQNAVIVNYCTNKKFL